MSALSNKIGVLIKMALNGQINSILKEIRRRLYSDEISYCLSRDLTVPFEAPRAKIPISIRPLQESDIPVLLNMDAGKMTGEAAKVRAQRLLLFKSNIQQCYVAVTEDNSPCYMQWLMGAEENNKIQELFKGGFPLLAPGEMLLEGAFTLEAFRGQRIMPEAMAKIAEKGIDFEARRIYTFVGADNIPSLKGCKRSGFTPYSIRIDRWRLFRRLLEFRELPTGTPYPFDEKEQVPILAHA